MSDRIPAGSRTLARISSLLDLPVEHFSEPDALSRWDSLAEGMQHLHRIESPDGQRRAFETLRAIADAEQGRDSCEGLP